MPFSTTYSDQNTLILQIHVRDGEFVGERHGCVYISRLVDECKVRAGSIVGAKFGSINCGSLRYDISLRSTASIVFVGGVEWGSFQQSSTNRRNGTCSALSYHRVPLICLAWLP
jgi:hypothetical protein